MQASESSQRFDFSAVPDAAVDEFHRQAELFLEGTIKLGLAADARASTSTSIMSAATAGAFILAGNSYAADNPHYGLIAATTAAGLLFMTAAGLFAWSCRPIHFALSGYEPDLLYAAAASSAHIKRVSAEDIQARIHHNTATMASAAKLFRRGQIAAGVAPLSFLIIFLLFSR